MTPFNLIQTATFYLTLQHGKKENSQEKSKQEAKALREK
jgi:hypothetical protein